MDVKGGRNRPVIREQATEFADADEAMRLEASVWW